jgi:hypothetical protein
MLAHDLSSGGGDDALRIHPQAETGTPRQARKRQRNENAAAARLLFLLQGGFPVASEGRQAIVGALVAEGSDQRALA